jgi:hypothetical protein
VAISARPSSGWEAALAGLGDPRATADTAVGVDGRTPGIAEAEGVHRVLGPPVDGEPEEEHHPGRAAGFGEVVVGLAVCEVPIRRRYRTLEKPISLAGQRLPRI